jgi:hypothetical protein
MIPMVKASELFDPTAWQCRESHPDVASAVADYGESMHARMEPAIEETLASQDLMILPDAPDGIRGSARASHDMKHDVATVVRKPGGALMDAISRMSGLFASALTKVDPLSLILTDPGGARR